MQTEINNSGDTMQRNLKDMPGMSATEILADLPVGEEENGYFVPYEKANSIKTIMSMMKASHSMLFKSAVTKGGIIIWKVANDLTQPAA